MYFSTNSSDVYAKKIRTISYEQARVLECWSVGVLDNKPNILTF